MGAMKSWIVLLVALLLGSGERVGAAAARLLEGRVTHVGDGDSLWLAPAAAGALSRRERVCRRHGLPVYRRCVSPPSVTR